MLKHPFSAIDFPHLEGGGSRREELRSSAPIFIEKPRFCQYIALLARPGWGWNMLLPAQPLYHRGAKGGPTLHLRRRRRGKRSSNQFMPLLTGKKPPDVQ